MKERPILFSAPMVRAILAGTKTQTRRILKPGPRQEWLEPDFLQTCGAKIAWADGRLGVQVLQPGGGPATWIACPFGAPGDQLWGREAWKPHSLYAHMKPSEMPQAKVFYRADDGYAPSNTPWVPGIHMPRWASRILMEITDVRVERLQDISEADAIAEGLYRSTPTPDDFEWLQAHNDERGLETTPEELAEFAKGVWMAPGVPQGFGLTPEERRRDQWGPTPQFCYQLIWEHINGHGSWEANPWVWVVEFAQQEPAHVE